VREARLARRVRLSEPIVDAQKPRWCERASRHIDSAEIVGGLITVCVDKSVVTWFELTEADLARAASVVAADSRDTSVKGDADLTRADG